MPTNAVAVRLSAPALPLVTAPELAFRLSGPEWHAPPAVATLRPEVGDTVLGFKLVRELGRGGFARVYLAHEVLLGNRPVVVKVSLRHSREAERLGRLRHPNVVPVHSVSTVGDVQVICMPYLGETTLADLIRRHRAAFPSRRSGRKTTAAQYRSTRASGSRPSGDPADPLSGPFAAPVLTDNPGGAPPVVGDPVAVLRVLAGLAAGLAHAHTHGILHLDIKPSNVLVTDDGTPLLFDFNLSLDGTRSDREHVGGTMPYMSIEQLEDMRARGAGATRVDARSDLYSLGVTAYELLTGELPFPPATGTSAPDFVAARRRGPRPVRELNPGVPPAVGALVHKLLAPDPRDRYQTAEQLHEDIGRHLADLPLRYGANPSWRERFGKWRRRNPRLGVRLCAAATVAAALWAGAGAHERYEAGRRAEATALARDARAALLSARTDLTLPDAAARERGAARARAALAAFGLPADPEWRTRPAARRLSGAEREALAETAAELLALLAHDRWRAADGRAAGDRDGAAREAWELNAAARGCFAPGAVPFLDRQAAELAPHAGRAFDPPPARPEGGPVGTFLEASALLAAGKYSAAADLLERVVSARPDHAAAQLALAYCRQQRGEYHAALERYKVAAALLPADPRPAFHRGQIFGLLKRPDRAEVEYTAALDRNPDLGDAYAERALARYRLAARVTGPDAFAGVEADLRAAEAAGASRLFVLSVRARVRETAGDAAGARVDRAAAHQLVPITERDFVARGWGRMLADPKGAYADFRAATERNPRSLVALQNQVHLLADRFDDPTAALVVAGRLADLYPEYAPAVGTRALLLARLGRRAEALAEIERARRLADDAETLFLAACVSARTGDRAATLDLLRKAVRGGLWDATRLTDSPDLKGFRTDPQFERIVESVRALRE